MNKSFLKSTKRRLRRLLSLESTNSHSNQWINGLDSGDISGSYLANDEFQADCKLVNCRLTKSYTAGEHLVSNG